jgi:AraC family transcriptional activator FtrA
MALPNQVAVARPAHVVAILLMPDTVAVEVALLQQIFGRGVAAFEGVADAAGAGANHYEVFLCGESERLVLDSGVDFGRLRPLEALLDADSVMVPGVDDPLAPRSPALLDAVRRAHAGGARMISYCGGAFVLGQAGVLDGRRATTHWLFAEEFRRRFPSVRLEEQHLYVRDREVFTSGGVLSATDLALHIVSLDTGQDEANDLARLLVSSPHRAGGQAQFVKESLRADAGRADDGLLSWLRENIHEPLTLEQVARRQHTSQRSLARNFRRRTGLSVLDWVNRERVARAKVLLETTDLRIGDVAVGVGFGSPESLRRHFERDVGVTARAYRAAFRAPSARERDVGSV